MSLSINQRTEIAERRLAARHDRLNAIKARTEYASMGEPGHGQDDLYWLIAEVDRLRAEVAVR